MDEKYPEDQQGVNLTDARTVTVGELVRRCNIASRGMGANNPNKLLLLNCGYALNQLVRRIHELEHPKVVN